MRHILADLLVRDWYAVVHSVIPKHADGTPFDKWVSCDVSTDEDSAIAEHGELSMTGQYAEVLVYAWSIGRGITVRAWNGHIYKNRMLVHEVDFPGHIHAAACFAHALTEGLARSIINVCVDDNGKVVLP